MAVVGRDGSPATAAFVPSWLSLTTSLTPFSRLVRPRLKQGGVGRFLLRACYPHHCQNLPKSLRIPRCRPGGPGWLRSPPNGPSDRWRTGRGNLLLQGLLLPGPLLLFKPLDETAHGVLADLNLTQSVRDAGYLRAPRSLRVTSSRSLPRRRRRSSACGARRPRLPTCPPGRVGPPSALSCPPG